MIEAARGQPQSVYVIEQLYYYMLSIISRQCRRG